MPIPRQDSSAAVPAQRQGLDVNQVGTFDGVDIFDLDVIDFEEKPWRKPGADITDYFNFGFNEDTWQMYCDKQKAIRDEFHMRRMYGDMYRGGPQFRGPPPMMGQEHPAQFPPGPGFYPMRPPMHPFYDQRGRGPPMHSPSRDGARRDRGRDERDSSRDRDVSKDRKRSRENSVSVKRELSMERNVHEEASGDRKNDDRLDPAKREKLDMHSDRANRVEDHESSVKREKLDRHDDRDVRRDDWEHSVKREKLDRSRDASRDRRPRESSHKERSYRERSRERER